MGRQATVEILIRNGDIPCHAREEDRGIPRPPICQTVPTLEHSMGRLQRIALPKGKAPGGMPEVLSRLDDPSSSFVLIPLRRSDVTTLLTSETP
jgi:hypothetical protein